MKMNRTLKQLLFYPSLLFMSLSSAAQTFEWTYFGTFESVKQPVADTYTVEASEGLVFRFGLKCNALYGTSAKIRQYILEHPPCEEPNPIAFCDSRGCYNTSVYETPEPFFVPLLNEPMMTYGYYLKGTLYPGDCCGLYRIKYTIFDANDIADSACLTVNMYVVNCATTGFAKNQLTSSGRLSAYPNPAVSTLSINYRLIAPYTGAKLMVYNAQGASVATLPITSFEGTLSLDVSGYAEGLYFYTLVTNNQAIETKKIIVSR